MDLDDLLTSAAPATTRRDDALQREFALLVAEAEQAVRRPRRRLRTGLIAGAVFGIVGVGATATAASIWRTPPTGSWDSDPVTVVQTFAVPGQGECRAVHRAQAITQQDSLAGVSDKEWEKALGESQRFLRNFDPTTVDQAAAAQAWLQAEGAARAEAAPSERAPSSTLGEAYIFGFTAELDARLDADLASKGLAVHTVELAGSFPMACLGWNR